MVLVGPGVDSRGGRSRAGSLTRVGTRVAGRAHSMVIAVDALLRQVDSEAIAAVDRELGREADLEVDLISARVGP